MTKFNTKGSMKGKTTNYEGAEAFELSPKAKLLNLTSTCMFGEPKFYGNKGEIETEILKLCDSISKKEPKYLLQLAAYLRNELYMRSISTAILVKAANNGAREHVRAYAPKIIKRADELTEAIACQLNMFGKPIPNSLKKGIADSFKNFDEYQFAKYNRDNEVKFKDVIMLTHPKDPSEIIKKILNDDLKVPYTWEVELSTKGNKPEVWEALIDSKKLPYMATLRNLRNILTTGETGVSDEHLDKVIEYIKNPEAVRKSKQFPFRFFSAYRELSNESYSKRGFWGDDNDSTDIIHPRISEVLDALEEAILISYENIPYMKGTTVLACDVSGSMESPISRNSKLQHFDIGLLLGAATHKYTDKAYLGMFGDIWKTIGVPKTSAGIISNTLQMHKREGEVGYSTNGYKVIKWMIDENKKVDRVLIFTDCQLWDSDKRMWGGQQESIRKYWDQYKQINPEARLYLFNLNGYGTVNFPEQDKSVTNINGWSDKVLQFIENVEKDPNAQVKYIEENY